MFQWLCRCLIFYKALVSLLMLPVQRFTTHQKEKTVPGSGKNSCILPFPFFSSFWIFPHLLCLRNVYLFYRTWWSLGCRLTKWLCGEYFLIQDEVNLHVNGAFTSVRYFINTRLLPLKSTIKVTSYLVCLCFSLSHEGVLAPHQRVSCSVQKQRLWNIDKGNKKFAIWNDLFCFSISFPDAKFHNVLLLWIVPWQIT